MRHVRCNGVQVGNNTTASEKERKETQPTFRHLLSRERVFELRPCHDVGGERSRVEEVALQEES